MNAGKWRKWIFNLAVIIAAGMIFIFNVLTPAMSDDLFYGKK